MRVLVSNRRFFPKLKRPISGRFNFLSFYDIIHTNIKKE